MRDHRTAGPTLLRAPHAAQVILVVLCAVVLTFGALFYLWQRYQFIRLGFEVAELRARKAALEERIEPLVVEAEYLSRLERIERIARESLGLRPPAPSQVLLMGDHGEPALPVQ